MPFLGFIMSAVIRGVAGGTCLDIAGFKQLPHSLKRRFVRRSIQPFSPDKAATFNSRIKSPKSQHWHLAKATEEGAEQGDVMLHWLV